MGIFGFFRRNHPALPTQTGLIGHWKQEGGGSNDDLCVLISLLDEGDNVTLIFRCTHIHQAAMAMRALSRKLRISKESLPTLIRGIIRHAPEEGEEHVVYESVSLIARNMPHRNRAEKRIFEKLHKYVIEFRVFRSEKEAQ